MKEKSSILVAVLCFALILPANAFSQSPGTRPRRVAPVEQPVARTVAYEIHDLRAPGDKEPRTTGAAEAVTLESFVPREGLRFYFEMRSGGLAELARAGNAIMPVTKMLAAGPAKVMTGDFAAFALSNAAALSSSKLAIVGYDTAGAAALIEAANSADAERLKAGVAALLSKNRDASKKPDSSDLDISLQGRMVIAGPRATVARLVESKGAFAISEDQIFMKAHERFAADPFFAYIEVGSQAFPATLGMGNTPYDAGMLSALSMTPYAIAMGGSVQGDASTVRALLMFNTKRGSDSLFGLFGFGRGATEMGQPVAASYVSPDADIFIDCMLDWDKLYDSIQSMFDRMASAQSRGGQSADLIAMTEASLGFSIKNDLLPTLGNEVAVSLSGFDSFIDRFALRPSSPKAAATQQFASPRFMLMIALKDPAKFEKLLSKLFNKEGSQPMQRATYRNATISYNKDIAFAVANNFFMLSGSVTNIRRAMDARALESSLATSADFRSAIGNSHRAMMQAYISSGLSNKLYEWILTEAAKANPSLKEFARKTAPPNSPVGLSVTPDSDGMMMELRVPTNLTFMALASLATSKPSAFSSDNSQPAGVGIPTPTGPSTRTRTNDGRRVPSLTDDDLRDRRP